MQMVRSSTGRIHGVARPVIAGGILTLCGRWLWGPSATADPVDCRHCLKKQVE